jgi:hypothetical protein
LAGGAGAGAVGVATSAEEVSSFSFAPPHEATAMNRPSTTGNNQIFLILLNITKCKQINSVYDMPHFSYPI